MGPIIQALSPNQRGLHPPRNFQELISQLDEVNKQVKSGTLMTANTANQARNDVEKLKKLIDEYQEKLEKQSQLMLKREAEWFHLAHPLREELSELRSFKQQV